MGAIGYGYGSEWHLLRYLGRHRKLFDKEILNALDRTSGVIEWLDFDFQQKKPYDRELKGLEFLADLKNPDYQ